MKHSPELNVKTDIFSLDCLKTGVKTWHFQYIDNSNKILSGAVLSPPIQDFASEIKFPR